MNQLRDFQDEDVQVLNPLPFALIGHEQGLGKTIIASQLDGFMPGTLVVCPASLRLNWEHELRVWRPDLSTQVLSKKTDKYDGNSDVMITSWNLLADLDLPACFTLVGDESHYMKNRSAARSKTFAKFAKHADRVYLMSGTPMPNRTRELWTQLKVLRATDMSYSAFTKRYSNARQTRFGWDDGGASNLSELKELVGKVMVRRLKKDVLKELPPKQFQIIELDGKVSAAEREFADEIIDASGHIRLDPKTTSFERLSLFRHETGLAKLKPAIEHIKMLFETNEKIILFGHHKDIVDQLMTSFNSMNPVKIVGGMSDAQKEASKEAFQNDDDVRLIIGSEAMYEGWTLTAGALVVFVELNWVPGRMAQAADRAHRIGQLDSVLVQFLVIRDGLDHRILESNFEKLTNIAEVI